MAREELGGGLLLSYFHFGAQPWIYQENICRIQTHKVPENITDPPSYSSPQYSAFIHPISTNKPTLSTLTVGFIPSTTQSASTKPNIHAGTGIQNYTHKNIAKRENPERTKIILFHIEMKSQIFWALSSFSISLCRDKTQSLVIRWAADRGWDEHASESRRGFLFKAVL